MDDKPLEFKLCSNCGSTKYIENYPVPGVIICEECGHEITSVALKVVPNEAEEELYSKHTCPFCHRPYNEEDEDVLFDKEDGAFSGGGIIVFQCVACGKLDGYRILPFVWPISEEPEKGSGDLSAKIAYEEGRSIYSASGAEKIAKALKAKERDPVEICQELFRHLLKEKTPKLLEIGVDPTTIDIARYRVQRYVFDNGPITEKQLEHLFPAEIADVQDKAIKRGYFKGKRLSEREMEEIFKADRKTIRKWKTILNEPSPSEKH